MMDLVFLLLVLLLINVPNYIYLLMVFFFLILLVSVFILFLGFSFITWMLILVYAGAVIVLFFFVVMLFDGNMGAPSKMLLFKFLILFLSLKCTFVLLLSSSGDVTGMYGDVLHIPNFFSDEERELKNLVVFKEAGDGFVGFYDNTNSFFDSDVFFIVSFYLYMFCVFEFYVCGLMLFVCMISVPAIIGVINKKKLKKK